MSDDRIRLLFECDQRIHGRSLRGIAREPEGRARQRAIAYALDWTTPEDVHARLSCCSAWKELKERFYPSWNDEDLIGMLWPELAFLKQTNHAEFIVNGLGLKKWRKEVIVDAVKLAAAERAFVNKPSDYTAMDVMHARNMLQWTQKTLDDKLRRAYEVTDDPDALMWSDED